MGFWKILRVGTKIFGAKVHPFVKLRFFRHLWSTSVVVAFCMGIAIWNRRKFG